MVNPSSPRPPVFERTVLVSRFISCSRKSSRLPTSPAPVSISSRCAAWVRRRTSSSRDIAAVGQDGGLLRQPLRVEPRAVQQVRQLVPQAAFEMPGPPLRGSPPSAHQFADIPAALPHLLRGGGALPFAEHVQQPPPLRRRVSSTALRDRLRSVPRRRPWRACRESAARRSDRAAPRSGSAAAASRNAAM